MRRVLIAALLVPFCVGVVPASADSEPGDTASLQLAWVEHPTGITGVRLRGLAAVSRDTAWASGNNGTVLRTADGGATWQNVSPTGVVDIATLQFRDIEAFDADTAVILGFGVGEEARVYRTTDAGAHWTETFRNTDVNAFYDCMAFFDHRHGLAVARPVDGKFRVLSTSDGGRSWSVLPNDGMPPALADEFTFAAGGRCISVFGGREAWIATAGPLGARVLHSRDRGLTWTASATPLAGSDTAGAFATAFRTPHQGIAVGGDVVNEPGAEYVMAFTRDGGATWTEPVTGPHGYRSAVTWWFTLFPIAVGPNGSDISFDGGRNWSQFSTSSFDAIDCTEFGACWASGARARVATLSLT